MIDFTEEQIQRYSRHILLQDVGVEGQEKIMNARVLVVGAGGLGAPVSLYLAAAGIGRIGIVDADVVEGNQMNKVVRTLSTPITTTRVRLQMIQGEQEAYTTRIYEFAVFGYLKKDDPVGIASPLEETEEGDAIYDLSGRQVVSDKW